MRNFFVVKASGDDDKEIVLKLATRRFLCEDRSESSILTAAVRMLRVADRFDAGSNQRLSDGQRLFDGQKLSDEGKNRPEFGAKIWGQNLGMVLF
jgi:hypothetical protein